MSADDAAFHQLSAYTLAHTSPDFLHQHVVDAHAVQCASDASKPIGVAFALAGLYLHVDGGRSGRQVQRIHRLMGQARRTWPVLHLPTVRGTLTARDVMAAPAGPARDDAIHAWCAAVWSACTALRPAVMQLLQECGIS